MPPSTHVQEEKYRIACEHHRTMVEQLNEAQREVNELKKNKTKLKSKISDFVGNASDRKRKLATLERCKLSLADALEIKAEAKNELDQALKAQAAAVEEDKEKRKMLSKYLEEQKEKKLMEEERLKAQRKLEAERVSDRSVLPSWSACMFLSHHTHTHTHTFLLPTRASPMYRLLWQKKSTCVK